MNKITNPKLREAFDGSYYTILGCGGDIETWKNGYQHILDIDNIGKITKWIEFTGAELNEEFDLHGISAFRKDLHCLAFSLEGLDVSKLAIIRISMQDRWFDDFVDNFISAKRGAVINDIL